jgi:hypothetical protein
MAQEYFPISREEAEKWGWKWRTEETKAFTDNRYKSLPIDQYDERVVGFDTATKNIHEALWWLILCEVSNKPFKIIKQELVFYIENNLPLPTKHPDQRHRERLSLRNGRILHERTCDDCKKTIISTYAAGIVCDDCYRKLIY